MILYVDFDDDGRPTASTYPQSEFAVEFDIDEPRAGCDPNTVIYAIDPECDQIASFDADAVIEWADDREWMRVERLPLHAGAEPASAGALSAAAHGHEGLAAHA